MTITNVEKSLENLTMIMTVELDASPERAWRLWSDPRELERWWGPPECPATFIEHDLTPGGRVTYFMTLPDGTRSHGWWTVQNVEPPRLLEFVDGFADDDGKPVDGTPITSARVTLTPLGAAATRMLLESRFESPEAMDRLLTMGMEEGITAAVGQIDAILAAEATR